MIPTRSSTSSLSLTRSVITAPHAAPHRPSQTMLIACGLAVSTLLACSSGWAFARPSSSSTPPAPPAASGNAAVPVPAAPSPWSLNALRNRRQATAGGQATPAPSANPATSPQSSPGNALPSSNAPQAASTAAPAPAVRIIVPAASPSIPPSSSTPPAPPSTTGGIPLPPNTNPLPPSTPTPPQSHGGNPPGDPTPPTPPVPPATPPAPPADPDPAGGPLPPGTSTPPIPPDPTPLPPGGGLGGWASNAGPSLPPVFVGLQPGLDERTCTITWVDRANNETGYRLEHQFRDIDGTWIEMPDSVRSLPANTAVHVDRRWGGTHRYRVAAIVPSGLTEWTPWTEVSIPDQWTDFTPSSDTRIIYVSSSTGSDSNDGLSPQRAKRSLAAAYAALRPGSADWLLLRRGDTWSPAFGISRGTSGRSSSERIVIASYGPSTARPKLLSGTAAGLEGRFSNVAIVGLEFVANERTGTESPSGIRLVGSGSDILVEDCVIDGYGLGIIIQGTGGGTWTDVALRRNVVYRSFMRQGAGHSNGLYAVSTPGILLEQNVFDHNGWWPASNAAPTIFNHNVYLDDDAPTGPAVVRGNIIARGAAFGAQLRAGGVLEDNLMVENALAALVALSPSSVRNNVVLHARDIDPTQLRGHGLTVIATAIGTVLENNLVAHNTSAGGNYGVGPAISVFAPGTTVQNNIVYDWVGSCLKLEALENQFLGAVVTSNAFVQLRPSISTDQAIAIDVRWANPLTDGRVVVRNNQYFSQASPNWLFRWNEANQQGFNSWLAFSGDTGSVVAMPAFPDPTRTIATYHASLGQTATIAAFLDSARQQSRFSWRSEYTAGQVNRWLRAGYWNNSGNQ